MGIKDIFNEAKEEKKVIEGKKSKDKIYSSKNNFADEAAAAEEFKRTVKKLFNVNEWSKLPGLTSDFLLHDNEGHRKHDDKPALNDYIKIILPGPTPENWVIVTDIKQEENLAEFTVSPSKDPTANGDEEQEIKHFFVDEASGTFRVELRGTEIKAFQIGRNEGINNQGKKAGDRELINTLIAEGGWAGFQKLQWETFTGYLVHKVELED